MPRRRTRRVFSESAALTVCAAALSASPARPQSLDLPLSYYLEQGDNLKLVAAIGIANQSPLLYTFDTGSAPFVAQYNSQVFGSIPSVQEPNTIFPAKLPTKITDSYEDGTSYEANLVGVPSVTFYPTLTSTSGVQISAQAQGGAASAFVVAAVTKLDGQPVPATPTPLYLPSPTGTQQADLYGDFGAGYWVIPQTKNTSATPQQGAQSSSVLGQAVIPGTSGGYIVAANGVSLNTITQIVGPGIPPAANVNGPQGTQNIASCSPCVILGLTPALVAQFQARNAFQYSAYQYPFWNSTNPSGKQRDIEVNYSFTNTSKNIVSGQTPTLFDTGAPSPHVETSGTVQSNSTFTYSGPAAGAVQISNTVIPKSPYGYAARSDNSNFGLQFFLQNSVMFDLTDQEVVYTPNFVTDVSISTTPANPLAIGADSVPLGLAGVISGSGGVTITTGGSATLSGANTYTGATTIAGGYLALVGPGSIAASSGVDVTQGGMFDISGVGGTYLGQTTPPIATIQSLSGDRTGMVFLGNSSLILTNASGTFRGSIVGAGGVALLSGQETFSGVNAYTGPTGIYSGGELVLAGGGSIAASTGVQMQSGAILDISQANSAVAIQSLQGDVGAMVDLGRQSLVLTNAGGGAVGNASGTFAGSIVGSGGLTLLQGTETLSGPSSFAGPTTIDGGMLVVDGALTGTSAVTVNAGGALTGTGTIDPLAVTIASGGVLAPGVSGGPGASMAIVGNLVLQPGSFYQVGLSPTASNAADISGAATLGGTVEAAFASGLYHPQRLCDPERGSLSGTFGGLETVRIFRPTSPRASPMRLTRSLSTSGPRSRSAVRARRSHRQPAKRRRGGGHRLQRQRRARWRRYCVERGTGDGSYQMVYAETWRLGALSPNAVTRAMRSAAKRRPARRRRRSASPTSS